MTWDISEGTLSWLSWFWTEMNHFLYIRSCSSSLLGESLFQKKKQQLNSIHYIKQYNPVVVNMFIFYGSRWYRRKKGKGKRKRIINFSWKLDPFVVYLYSQKKLNRKEKKKFLVVSNDLLFCCSPEKHKAAINQWTTAYHHWVVLICRIFFSLVGVAFNTGATTKDRQRKKKIFHNTKKEKHHTSPHGLEFFRRIQQMNTMDIKQ